MTLRFPPPWSVEQPDPKLERQCYIIRDADGDALAYVYFEDEPARRVAAHLLTRGEARRNIAMRPSAPRGVNFLALLSLDGRLLPRSRLIFLTNPPNITFGAKLLSGDSHA